MRCDVAIAPPRERLDATVVFDNETFVFAASCGSLGKFQPEQLHVLPEGAYGTVEATARQPQYIKALGCEWLTADGAPVLSLNDRQPYARLRLFSTSYLCACHSLKLVNPVLPIDHRTFCRSATRDVWGARFSFEKWPDRNGVHSYPNNCTLLINPILAVDNGTRLRLRFRGRNLTHNIEFHVPHAYIRVKSALSLNLVRSGPVRPLSVPCFPFVRCRPASVHV